MDQFSMFDGAGIVLVPVGPVRKPNPGHRMKPTETASKANPAEKFRAMADTMQCQIDAKLADRQTNTARRLKQAMSARADGERLQRTQQALRALADAHEKGTVPPVLAGIASKKAVHDLMAAKMERVGNGYHDYMVDTGKPREGASEAVLALWAMIDGKTPEQEKADRLAQMERDLQFSQIPGYFPTPDAVIDVMLDYAQVEPTHSVLEPSAGSGAIVDRLPEDCLTVVYEINPKLCEVLQAKGFDARPLDFLKTEGTFSFDRVLMNPPFEKQQDIDHVLHAYKRLKSGGRLVAVMSPSQFFRTNSKSTIFRAFLETNTSEVIDLPDGSFKESGTGVSAKLVIIDKE